MTLAIALVAVFAISQFLVFGVLLAFAIRHTRMEHQVLDTYKMQDDLIEDITTLAEALTAIADRLDKNETWAESVTELNAAIVDRLNGEN